MEQFKSSMIILVIGLALGFYIGGIEALYIVALLAILEISLSFDNAVVNVKVLEGMEEVWQQRFITWGIPIAVFGMRFLLPMVMVAVASGLGVWETFEMALHTPTHYQAVLHSVETLIFAFGGSFLLMVFLSFIFDEDRQTHWIKPIEQSRVLHKLGKLANIQMTLATLVGTIITLLTQSYLIALSYFLGVLLYAVISSLDELLSINGVRSGVMGFLYLEVLDASFSFDGVIGAFALSSNIFIIMLGLGIGAMFVRSLTLFMLQHQTLSAYRYLEHGAHYAILALAIIMLIKIFMPISELVVGTVGIGFIVVATLHSIYLNRHAQKEAKELLKSTSPQ